jgi:penicillin-binding protein 1C
MSAEAAWMIADMLGGDERVADTAGHAADARLPRMAWKTGTSSGFRDAWAVAFNPEIAVGVWFGRPDGRGAAPLVGAAAAVPAAWEIFRALYPSGESPWFARPEGVKERSVCAVSGMPPGPCCGAMKADAWIPGVTRHAACSVHRRIARRDADGTIRTEVEEVWPAEVTGFLARRRAAAAPPAIADGDRLRIVTPVAGSVYRRLGALSERIVFTASGASSGETLWWFLNDTPLVAADAGAPVLWDLRPGRHVLVCADAAGHADRAPFTVE